MQKESARPGAYAQNEMWLTIIVRYIWFHRGIRVSIGAAIALFVYDAFFTGSDVWSGILCPLWSFASLVKNAMQRPGWRLGLLRMAIPLLTLGLVVGNSDVQLTIAKANAARVVAACEEFHAAKGTFPNALDDLVPQYMSSIPPAKYCLTFGEFDYFYNSGNPMLVWCVVPPFYRKIYDFNTRRWNYIE